MGMLNSLGEELVHLMRGQVKMVFRKLEVAMKRACCGWAEGSERSQLPPH